VLVALSGMHTDQRQAAARQLSKLRLRHSTESNAWRPGTTHLLSPSLTRTDKALATMAAGGWLLREGWAALASTHSASAVLLYQRPPLLRPGGLGLQPA
jgi:hypothetical protein